MKKYFVFTSVLFLMSFIDITSSAQTITNVQTSNPLCFGEFTGNSTINVSQTSPANDAEVKLLWQNPNTGFWVTLGTQYSQSPNYETSFIFPSLSAGEFRIDLINTVSGVLLEDVFFTLTQPTPLLFSVSTTNFNGWGVACNGGVGSIYLSNPIGGNGAPISYSFDGGITFIQYWNQGGLQAGNYTLAIKDALGCITYDSTVLTEPLPITISSQVNDVSCNSFSDGTINIIASGGVLPFSYSWNDGQISQQIVGLSVDTFSCIIIDANGCNADTSVIISEPDVLLVTSTIIDNLIPFSNLAAINTTIFGGTLPYQFDWVGPNNFTSSQEDIDSLVSGIYYLTTSDYNGCLVNDTFEINEPGVVFGCTDSTALNFNAASNINNGTCYYCTLNYNLVSLAPSSQFNCNGWIWVSIPLAFNPVNYFWSTGAPTSDFAIQNLCNDFYSLTIVDDNECGADTIILLSNFVGCMDTLALNYDSTAIFDDNSCILFIYGCLDSTAANYNILANTDDGSCVPDILGCMDTLAINYNPLANTDNGSCIAAVNGCTDTIMFNYDPLANVDDSSCFDCSFNYNWLTDTANISSCGASAALIVSSINPGPLAYNWNVLWGSFCCYPTIPLSTDLCLGIYTMTVTDVYGCTLLDTIEIGNVVLGCTDPLATNYDPTANLDDGSCTYVPSTCTSPSPTGAYVSELIHDRVRVNWDNMNDTSCMLTQYRIRYRELGTSTWLSKTMANSGLCLFGLNTTSKKVVGLTPSTTYEYYMKAWYCGGGVSTWSATQNFTTADECENVVNFAVGTPTTTKAEFTWDTTAAYSFARIKLRVDTTGGVWTSAGGFGVFYPALSKAKNGLTPGISYRAQARTWCDTTGGTYRSAAWSPLIFWTQPTTIKLAGESLIANLTIYPNPSRDVFNISFTTVSKQNLKVRILNVICGELMNENLEQFIGEYTKQINLTNNAKGIYFLEIEMDDGIINKKLILQ
jgi:hypothetical protein